MVGSWQGQGKQMTCPSWHCPAGSVLHPLLPLPHASALGPASLVLSISAESCVPWQQGLGSGFFPGVGTGGGVGSGLT